MPKPSKTKQNATLLDGSALKEQPPLLGASGVADADEMGAGGTGAADGVIGAADGISGGVVAEGGGVATDAEGFGTFADTQRKCALNLKCKWSSFSLTQMPGSVFILSTSMK